VLTGCQHTPELAIDVQSVAPGRTIRISSQEAVFADMSAIDVKFGDRPAAISQIDDKQTIVVVVPKLNPGQVKVTVWVKGNVVGHGGVTIAPPSKRRLFLTYDDGVIELDRVEPYTGHFDRPVGGGMRISYDVLSEKGVVVHRGAIANPGASDVEVFAEPEGGGSIRRVTRVGRIPFVVKIPYRPGRTVVRFYVLEPGRNLAVPEDRAARTFIREFEIEHN
jgi:hypothetical protein